MTEGVIASGSGCARLTLFGAFALSACNGSPINIANRRARALLAMLAVEPGHKMSRIQIAKLLWPGRFEAQARASLRQCLLELAKTLEIAGIAPLDVSRDYVALATDALHTDLADAPTGSKLLLEDFTFGDAFDDWLCARRGEIEDRRLSAHPATFAQTSSAAFPPAIRIAVLPFQPVGSASDADYFADGMVDELITTLGQVPQLLVAGRTSSFHFRNSALPPHEIASALGVSHLIEGSVQRQGEQVRIHAHLLAGDTGFELWGQRFDGSLDDVFALQETMAQAVTAAIGDALGIAIQPPLVPGLTSSKAAYDLYLQGRALNARLFGDGVLTRAAELLEEAVGLDPGFAEAWLLLGDVHQRMGIYGGDINQAENAAKMADCVRKALAINPDLGHAYGLLALHEFTRNNIVGSLDLAFKGYEVEPNNPAVSVRLGGLLLFCGRTREGMRYLDEAIDQDPVDGRHYMVRSAGQLNLGDVDAAIVDAQRCVDLAFPSMWLGVAQAAAGQHDVAVESYQKTRYLIKESIPPPAGTGPMPPEMIDAYWLVAAKGVCSGRSEDREAYCRTLDFLHTTMADKEHLAITLPAVFMGYADLLFKTIGTRITLQNLACLMSIWADIEPIRQIWQHPEFIPFAQRIGMAAAWDKYGWPDLLPVPSNRV